MEQDNIIWKDMVNPSEMRDSKMEIEPCQMDTYSSLYVELKEKCNPEKYLFPYNKEKVDIANALYKKLIDTNPIDNSALNIIRDQAIQKLGIVLSTKKQYLELLEYCNPKNFMNPYNYEAIEEANKYYALIYQYRNDIHELEILKRKVSNNNILTLYYSQKNSNVETDSDTEFPFLQIIGAIIIYTVFACIMYIIMVNNR